MARIPADRLQGVPETMLPVLYARAYESRRSDGIIHDPVALQWVERIAYDFSRFEDTPITHFGVAVRTEILDELAGAYLQRHPDAVIVNVGAGLDTRCFRLNNGQRLWVELDLPESLAVRRQLVSEDARYRLLAYSALDVDHWRAELPAGRPLLFIVEGLLMYFSGDEVRNWLSQIAEHFPGAHLLCEVMGVGQAERTHLNDAISKTSAQFRWGIREAAQMADWHPRLRYLTDISIYDRHEDRWRALPIPFRQSLVTYRNSVNRIVHLQVDPA